MSYYYVDSEKKIIREELLTTDASSIAEKLARGREKMTGTQLRKYFSEVRSLETQVEAKGFDVVKPMIKMLKSKVAYGRRGRSEKEKKVSEYFLSFINNSVDKIDEPEDFDAFIKHFEAIVGFFYGEGGRD